VSHERAVGVAASLEARMAKWVSDRNRVFTDPPNGCAANADHSACVAGTSTKVTAEVHRVERIRSRPMDHLSKHNGLNVLFVFSFFAAFVMLIVRFG
jgi:hypothetical protein